MLSAAQFSRVIRQLKKSFMKNPVYKSLFLVIITLAVLACKKKESNSLPAELRYRILTHYLNQPWEILWGPDNHIWMTQRSGTVSRVNPATGGDPFIVYTIPEVSAQGEGGLLGMVLHPQFNSNKYVYVVYNYLTSGNYREKVVRYTYNGTTFVDPLPIIQNITAASIHNGSRLLFIGDKLFITTGDAANTSLPQNNGSLNGKILRLNADGSIPADNPTPGSAVWTNGHRNPQGLVYANDILYSSEHGPDTDDEINIIEKGRNYGWPTVRGYCESGTQTFCTTNNVKEPIKAWTPTIAVSGMDYYNNDYIPQWKNSLLVATLKHSRLVQLTLSADHKTVTEEREFFSNTFGRIRDIAIAPDGKVYLCTGNGSDDKLVVIERR
jgi:aldose sugar dehydrogenase